MGCDPKCPDLTVTLVYSSFLFSLFLYFFLVFRNVMQVRERLLSITNPRFQGQIKENKIKIKVIIGFL